VAWLNIKADSLAKARIEDAFNGPTSYQIPHANWQVEIGGKWVVKNLKKRIWDACNGPIAKAYWTKKYGLTQSQVNDFDTEALEQAMDESTPA